jgi:hypothetical protein
MWRNFKMKTIQERNQALIQRLNDMVRDTPISGSFGLLGQLLVDQGLADTRAGAIDDACNYDLHMAPLTSHTVSYNKLISAICNCDGSNFPWLLKIAPRLIKICLENKVDLALVERTEEAFEKIDRKAS